MTPIQAISFLRSVMASGEQLNDEDNRNLDQVVREFDRDLVSLANVQAVRFTDKSYISRGDGGWRASSDHLDDEYTYTTFQDAVEAVKEALIRYES